MRFLGVLLAALAAVSLAACGGSDGADAGGAAEAVPGDVALYAELDTDFEGSSWDAVQELAARFPGGENLLDRVSDALEEDGELSFEEDVEPAVGSLVALVVLEFDAGGEGDPPFLFLTQPDDPEALRRIVETSDDPGVVRELGDWHAAAESEEVLDRFEALLDGPRLSDSEAYADAMDGLPEDALARLYVDGETLAGAAESAEGGGLDVLGPLLPGGRPPSIGAVLVPEGDGARFDARLVYGESVESSPFSSEPYEAELPGLVPGDALAYASFKDLENTISAYRDAFAESEPELERMLGIAEAFLGVSLEADVAPLLADEGALYVRRGAVVPEVTLVTRIEDEEQALETLDTLVAAAGGFEPRLREVQRVDVDGVEARELAVAPPVSVFYAAFDGLLVVTTSRDGIAGLREEGDRLADSEPFGEALDDAGMPDETSGFLWVDLGETLPLVLGFAEAGAGEDTSEARAYADPLRSLVAWGTQQDDVQEYSLVVGVE